MKNPNLNNSYKALVEAYAEYLQTLGFADTTVYGFPRYISDFLTWLEQKGINKISLLTSKMVFDYFAYLERKKGQRTKQTLSTAHLKQTFGAVDKFLELSNHLGNVLAVINDVKYPVASGTTVDYFEVALVSVSDYSPFGMQMPGRSFQSDEYRRGFNGMEKDDEIKGEGNSYDFGARMYDPRVGRWLSTDSYERKYPEITPYAFVQNSTISMMDPDGNEGIVVSGQPGNHKNKEHFLINGLHKAKAAKKKVKNKSEKVTWMIYDSGDEETGHDPAFLKQYKEKAAEEGINVIVVTNEDEIVNYMNKKSTDDKDGGRSKDLISSFYYVGHATPGQLDVGYAEPGIDDYVTAPDFDPEAFASGAWVNLVGGCRTAVDGWIEDSVLDEFTEILDDKSTVHGSNVRVQYDGGVISDENLVKENKGKIVTKKGELPTKEK